MDTMDSRPKFHWADYLLFGISMSSSLVIGLYFAIKERWNKQSSESYFMADRKMNFILVALSYLATAQTANVFVGVTAEFYYYGITIIWATLGYGVTLAITAVLVVPKFFMLGYEVTSIYEYFEYRFNLAVRMASGLLYAVLSLLFMAVVIYIPSLVMAEVSHVGIYGSIAIGSIVCILYTAFGGMKAVIWVDSIQVVVMVISMSLLAGLGITAAGGFTAAWETYADIGERNNWNDTSADPWNRHTIWNIVFLLGLNLAAGTCASQDSMQRFMTVPSMKRSQLSAVIGIVVGLGFLFMVMFIGIGAFAVVGGNEPLVLGEITKGSQILPYYLMSQLGYLKGLPGLVVAALYAAALSTVSSGQNAIAAVIVEDFVVPIYKMRKGGKDLPEKTKGDISRYLGISVGVVILAIAIAIPNFNDTLLSLTLSVQSFITGPLFGLIMVGFFFFWVEGWGALAGLICSEIWAITIYSLSLTRGNGLGQDFAPVFLGDYAIKIDIPVPTAEPAIYDVSYTWYVFLDMLVMMIVSSIVSLCVHAVKHKRLRKSDMMPREELLYTLADLKLAMGMTSAVRTTKIEPMKTVSETELQDLEKSTTSINDSSSVKQNGVNGVVSPTPSISKQAED